VSEEEPKIIEKRTERKGLLRRVSTLKVKIGDSVVEEKRKHFVAPIQIVLNFFWWLFPLEYVIVKAGNKTVKRRKPIFRSQQKFVAEFISEEIAKEREK